jgi:16S rRNA (cytidine1402-2'-O)-methyltransferase
MNADAKVYLIPSFIEADAIPALSPYLLAAVLECQVLFAENERSTRRFLKSLSKEIDIDRYQWFTIGKTEEKIINAFREKIMEGKIIGILSEAGCPGIADPGQLLVAVAQQEGVLVRPFVGPSAILLALMGSGMNGQTFQFNGYLPIELSQRTKKVRELEMESRNKKCTQLFIETPYRNNQLLETLVKTCNPSTQLCIASNLNGKEEFLRTKTMGAWKKNLPELNKKPTVFCLLAH